GAPDWGRVIVSAGALVGLVVGVVRLAMTVSAWRQSKQDSRAKEVREHGAVAPGHTVALERIAEYLGDLPSTVNQPLRHQFEEARAVHEESLREEHLPRRKAGLREAIRRYSVGLGLSPRPSERAALFVLMGNCFLALGRLGEALDSYGKALSAALGIEDESEKKRARAAALGNQGAVYLQRGNLERAGEYFQAALTLHKEVGYRLGEAQELGNLGIVYRHKGDLEQALEHHRQALAIHKEIGHRLGEARDLGNLGIVSQHKGDLEQALEHHRQALAIHKETGYSLGEARDLGNLGIVYGRKGDLKRAEEHYERALRLFEELGAKADAEIARRNIEELRRKKGEP
ncbi:MAG: tetratricopeptide repeat protein, partial [Chloroflexota bacterium]|nr:tetratricopeptide repeat protein [Chloroflexota bacterium]